MSIEYNDPKSGLSLSLQESAFEKYAARTSIQKNIFVSSSEIFWSMKANVSSG